jgi:uncharacterized protein YkwD
MAKWQVYEADGAWDVTRNGRAFRYGYDDPDEAIDALMGSRKWRSGDVVYLDGRKV